MHTDQYLIEGLMTNNHQVIEDIYKTHVPKVVRFIENNNGSYDDAQDVVQDVLVSLYNQTKTKGLQLTCPFDAYFFLLCKRKWLNVLSSSQNKKVTNLSEDVSIDKMVKQQVEDTELFDDRQQLFEQALLQIGDKCKELLKLSFVTKSLEEVAQKLNVTYAYVRKKKSLCTGELTKLIQSHPNYKTLSTNTR